MASGSDIIHAALRQYAPNRLIVANELYQSLREKVKEATFYKSLERMTKAGELVHLTKGVYYRPKQTRFGVVPISEHDIASHYMGDRRGLVVGYRMYNQKGLTTQISKNMEILSTALSEERKHILNVLVRKISVALDEETKAIIETLEILQGYRSIEDLNRRAMIAHLEAFADGYSDAAAEKVLSSLKYKKSTIAFMANVLDYRHVKHSLRCHLSTVSDYNIPSMETLYETA